MNIFHHTVFPSIITETQCDLYRYIRNDLIEWIYNYQLKTDNVIISNRGGWQSPSNFYEQESFSEFKNYIMSNVFQSLTHYNKKFKLANMWININKKGNYNVSHNHPDCIMSGVFWVKTSEKCGQLTFENHHTFAENTLIASIDKNYKNKFNYYHDLKFIPKEETLIIFPAHLRHHVEPNESDEDRISIAFNLS